MSDTQPCTAAVLESIVAMFRDEFEGRFRVVYEDTVRMMEAHPREPESEAFNAFEHFSLACKYAAEADVPSATAAVVEEAKKQTQKNLGQAHRHLSVGRFFCIEHQIIRTMEGIRDEVARLPEDVRLSKSNYQERCDTLEAELRSAVAIEIKPIEDPVELAEAVRDFENNIDGMTKLLVRFLRLADDIVGPGTPSPPST